MLMLIFPQTPTTIRLIYSPNVFVQEVTGVVTQHEEQQARNQKSLNRHQLRQVLVFPVTLLILMSPRHEP